jgi:3-phosphoshikimate 1-carboxyvinyltransferase
MRVALIGVGMIGGSLVAAWRRAGVLTSVTGFDVDERALTVAAERGLVDRRAPSIAQAVADADLVLVATPVGAMREVFEAVAPVLPAGALVTDVGSTKGDVIDCARAALGTAFGRFVPAHPIAGKERPGVEHADDRLFEGKRVILTPAADTRADALARVEALFARTGATVERMEAAEHDRIFAAVSHLPHLLSFALVAAIGSEPDGERKLGYGGAGFRDFTRIAASSPVMWRDICVANRAALGDELRGYRLLLDRLQQAVDAGDAAALERSFEQAARLRRQWAAAIDEGAGALRGADPAAQGGEGRPVAAPGRPKQEKAGARPDGGPARTEGLEAEPDWPPVLTVAPIAHAQGTVRLPGSKSISNRALLLAALAEGTTVLSRLLDADDTRVMIDALRALGVTVERDGDMARVDGCGGRLPARRADVFVGNAGTVARSLTAALAFADGEYRLDGVARMRERPIGDLVDALNVLGARIAYEGQAGFPPLRIGRANRLARDEVAIRGDVSSQFVSGLLMAAPLAAPAAGLRVRVDGPLISQPYVAMTVAMMRRFGVAVARDGESFVVPRGGYVSPGPLAVEGDASSASYFLALGLLAGGPVRVEGVGRDSVQGDVAFADLLEAMGGRIERGSDWIEARAGGSLRPADWDCTAIPDAAMTAAVVAMFAPGRSRLRGIGSWRVKETDRIAAMAAELRKCGAIVDSGADWIEVTGPTALREATVETYDDHRIAMCFALAAAGGVPVHIRDPRCVSKTFPRYFAALSALARPPAP